MTLNAEFNHPRHVRGHATIISVFVRSFGRSSVDGVLERRDTINNNNHLLPQSLPQEEKYYRSVGTYFLEEVGIPIGIPIGS